MLTTIIITAVITFVVATWVMSSIISKVEDRTNRRLEKFNNRLDRYYQKQNNYEQRTANSLDMIDGQISKRIDKVDAHLHELIEEEANALRKNMRLVLSLLGVESVSENKKEELVLAHYFDGSRKISKLDKSSPFVPVKATKLKKGAEITEYNGEKLEFTLPAKTDL